MFGALLMAGSLGACTTSPDLGTVTPSPQVKTAPESSSISAECRGSLSGVAGGPDLLVVFDQGMGAVGSFVDPAGEATNLLAALEWGARQVGITDCP